MNIRKHYIEVKKVLRKNKYSGIFSGKYSFSPYRACSHACKYCDGRYEKYYIEGDFEKDIVIRKNISDLLDKEVDKIRERGIISVASGVSDPYQPVEKEERIMNRCSEILSKNNIPVSVMTKSSLIIRDIDNWKKVHDNNFFSLMVSLVYSDDSIRKIFEPFAGSVEERLETLRTFKEKGMYTGVTMMPLIPYISDSEKQIIDLVEKLKEINVDFIWPGCLTLKSGKQKALFFNTIKSEYPAFFDKFKDLYKQEIWTGEPSKKYLINYSARIVKILKDFSIPMRPPHYMYKDKVYLYDELFILLEHMKSLYFLRGVNIKRLSDSVRRYNEWLFDEKKYYGRKRKSDYMDIDNKIKLLMKNNKFNDILKNDKLCTFLDKIVLERMTFNYSKMKIENN